MTKATKLDKEIQEGLYDPKAATRQITAKEWNTKKKHGYTLIKNGQKYILRLDKGKTVLEPVKVYDPKNRQKSIWMRFVNAHKHIRTAKGSLDLKAIGKLWRKEKRDRQERYRPHIIQYGVKKAYDPKNTIEKAKAFFKVTKNPYEAGYIMPDGSMLDLSGRHYASGYKNSKPLPGQPDYLRNQRSVDHREVAEVIGKGGTAGMLMFMKETGAIRLAVLGTDINIALFNSIKPTLQQKKTLTNIINYTGGTILYDRWDEKGDTIKSGEVSSAKVFDPKASSLPPTRWYEAMVKGIKKSSDVGNPYAIVKSIWAKLSPSKRAEFRAREKKREHFKYDLPLPVDKPTKGTGTVRMVKPFKLAEVQVNLSVKDYLAARASGLFSRMKRHDGTIALVSRCKSPKSNTNIFIDKIR